VFARVYCGQTTQLLADWRLPHPPPPFGRPVAGQAAAGTSRGDPSTHART